MSKPGPTLPFRVVPPPAVPPPAPVSAAVVAAASSPPPSSSPPQPATARPKVRSTSSSVSWRRVTRYLLRRCRPLYDDGGAAVRSEPADPPEADVESCTRDQDQEQHARIAEAPPEL